MGKMVVRFFAFCAAALVLSGLTAYAQQTYRILPESTILISGTSTLSNWVVRSQQLSGEMIFTPDSKSAKGSGNGTIKDAKAILEVSSIKSEKGETMDNKMYTALKMETHPKITFSLTQPISIPKAPGKLSVTGNVNLAGVTKPMTFDLNLASVENGFHFKSTKTLKLSDFEIEPPTAMFGQIETGDEIVVELDLLFGK